MNNGPGKPPQGNVPKGALMIVGLVFVSIMALWFLVLGIVQARV